VLFIICYDLTTFASPLHAHPFISAFAKLRQATTYYLRHVRPSVRMEKLGSHWTDFNEI